MPTPTDLVTDLPADFEVFGQAVDTSMADLKGGTTGQILSKATNADMDFTWITNDVGDITNIAVTSPITGGGSSGSVTIGVSAASTSASGVVQLSDSTSTTSSVLASTPTATKSAYDLANTANTTANAAIPATTVTTAGDIIYRNATVPTRLGIGTAGQVLAVNSGATAPEWKTVSSSPTYSGAAIYKTSTQSVANTVATAVTFDSEYLDTDAYHSTATNTSRFTIPSGKDGKFLITANLGWSAQQSATTVLFVYKNGAQMVTSQYPQASNASSGGLTSVTISAIVAGVAGDYFEIYAYQNAGTLDISGNRVWATLSFLGA